MKNFYQYEIIKASAGSGKTTALGKRLLKLLLLTNENILAITFTNNAAKEMYERIIDYAQFIINNSVIHKDDNAKKNFSTLLKNEKNISSEQKKLLRKKLLKIFRNPYTLRISTIDSFFLQILKSFPLELSISLNLSIKDENEIKREKEVFKRNLLKKIASDKNILKILNHPHIKIPIFKIEEFFQIYDKYNVSLLEYIENFNFENTKELLYKLENLQQEIYDKVNSFYEEIKPHKDELSNRGQNKLKAIKSFLDGLSRFDKIKNVFLQLDPFQYRDFKKLKLHGPQYSLINEVKEYIHILSLIKENIFLNIAKKYFSEWEKYLDDKGIITFNIINQKIYKIYKYFEKENYSLSFSPLDIYFYLDGQISHFLFDEFQDTNYAQFRFFELLFRENIQDKSLFFVGDLKQSIYRFRGATPDLFKNLPQTLHNIGINEINNLILKSNFRSDKTLISFFNDFFYFCYKQYDYHEESVKQFYKTEKKYPDNLSLEEIPLSDDSIRKIEILKVDAQNEESEICHLNLIPEQIEKLVTQLGYDYQDIAVIAYRREELKTIGNALNKRNIPYLIEEAIEFNKFSFFHIIKALLSFILFKNKNYLWEILYHYLYPIEYQKDKNFNFSWDEFLNTFPDKNIDEIFNDIYLYTSINVKELIEKLENKVNLYPIDIIIKEIILHFNFINHPYVPDNFKEEYKKILNDFLYISHKYSTENGYQLYKFILYLIDNEETLSTLPLKGANKVNLFTIHKSKGLEFPIVFYYHNAKKFSLSQNSVLINTDPKTFKVKNIFFKGYSQLLGKISDIIRGNLSFKEYEENEKKQHNLEELNKLYVACTRAKKALFIYYNSKNYAFIEDYLKYKNIKLSDETLRIVSKETLQKNESKIVKIDTKPKKKIINWKKYIKPLEEKTEIYNLENLLFSKDNILLGILFHYFMEKSEFLKDKKLFDFYRPWKKLKQKGLEFIDKDIISTLKTLLSLVNKSEKLKDLFSNATEIHKEIGFFYYNRTYFLDVFLIYPHNKAFILDYKVTDKYLKKIPDELEKYYEQINNYEKIVKNNPHFKNFSVEKYLINVITENKEIKFIRVF